MTSVLDVPALQGPPDIGAALQMLSEGLAERRARREEETKRLLAQNIGGSLAGGDFQGAANTAFASGDIDSGIKITDLGIKQQAEMVDVIARHAASPATETPEGWEAFISTLEKRFPNENIREEWGPFENRQAAVDEAMTVSEQLAQQVREETAGREEKRLGLEERRVQMAEQGAQGGAKPSAGFQNVGPGEQDYIRGGSHDPVVIEREAKARGAGQPARSRTLTTTAITDISEKGAAYDNFSRLSGTWNDEYGGFISETAGDIANWAGRNMPGATELRVNTADWWQDYQTQKNIVRNKLFGSALTATEKGEFEKANIQPGMRSDIIKKNLARQTAAVTKAAKKLANVYIQQGFSPDVIEAGMGVSLGDLGLEGLRTGDVTAEPAAPEEVDENEVPQAFIDAGMDPDDWRFVDEKDKDAWR